MIVDPLPQTVAALLLSFVFAAAAVPKFGELPTFAAVVANYRLLPGMLVTPFAYALPVIEIATAILLLVPTTRPVGAALSIALLGLFALAIAVNVKRGRTTIDCGCFRSTLRQTISGWMVLRNLILCAAASLCLLAPAKRALGAADIVFALFAAAALVFLYLAVGLVTQRPPPRYEDNYRASLGQI